jgi:hypothetical protein
MNLSSASETLSQKAVGVNLQDLHAPGKGGGETELKSVGSFQQGQYTRWKGGRYKVGDESTRIACKIEWRHAPPIDIHNQKENVT